MVSRGFSVCQDVCAEVYLQTARIASSNTVFKPFCVKAEHSRYFTAPISFAIATPCEYWMGAIRLDVKVNQTDHHRERKCGAVPVPQFFDGPRVFTQVELSAYQDNRCRRCMMRDFRIPLCTFDTYIRFLRGGGRAK